MFQSKCRLFLFFICCMIFTHTSSHALGKRQRRVDRKTTNVAKKVRNPVDDKKFVIVICSYNNAEYAEGNMTSALSQVYPHYRVIFTDDASTDGTFKIAKEVVKSQNATSKVRMLRNSSNKGAMANVYRAVQSCDNDEIVVILDGDDQLNGPYVLKSLSSYYNNKDVWMTYGSYIESTSKKIGIYSCPLNRYILKAGKIKRESWKTSHLRTFYAGLFKQIKTSDLFYDGRFVPMATDVAAMLPMIEMAREHTFFIAEPLYIYNLDNPINIHKSKLHMQLSLEKYLKSLPVNRKLENPPWVKSEYCKKSDVMAFSYDRPLQLYAFLESLRKYVKNVGQVYIIYRFSSSDYEKGYNIVKQDFPHVHFIPQNHTNARSEFKSLVMKHTFKSDGYITFATDDLIIKDSIDFAKDIEALEKTQMFGFYYRHGKSIDQSYTQNRYVGVPNLVELGDDLYCWQFAKGDGSWAYPNSVDFVLYRKKDVKAAFEGFYFTFPNDLEARWHRQSNLSGYGLCHAESKMVNFPLNLVSVEFGNRASNEYSIEVLLKLFLKGKKIDLKPLHRLKNRAPHMEIKPTFVKRG